MIENFGWDEPDSSKDAQPAKPPRSKNELLIAARKRKQSTIHPDKCMTRGELAEAINSYIAKHLPHVKSAPLDHRSIGTYENGYYRWPGPHLRESFRAILNVKTDTELGFYTWGGRNEADITHIPSQQHKQTNITTYDITGPDEAGNLGAIGNKFERRSSSHQKAIAGDKLHRALTVPNPSLEPLQVADLGRAVTGAWHKWQSSPTRYSQLIAELPTLIPRAELTLDQSRRDNNAADQREAYRHAADLYGLVRTVAKRIGRLDLSLVATDRAMRAAAAADDPLRLAGSRWNLAQVLLSDGQAEDAETVALSAIDELRPETERGDLDALALHGMLLLVAAIAAARRGDAWSAWQRLDASDPIAQTTGERNTLWTAFGPTNVHMFAVSVSVETKKAADGLRLAEQIDRDLSPSIERRVAFLLDQAKSYQQNHDHTGTLMMLTIAEREAPEDVAYRPAARMLLHTLKQRAQLTVAHEAVRLANRVGITL